MKIDYYKLTQTQRNMLAMIESNLAVARDLERHGQLLRDQGVRSPGRMEKSAILADRAEQAKQMRINAGDNALALVSLLGLLEEL